MNFQSFHTPNPTQRRKLVWFFVASRIWAGPEEIDHEFGSLIDCEIRSLAQKYEVPVQEVLEMNRMAKGIAALIFDQEVG